MGNLVAALRCLTWLRALTNKGSNALNFKIYVAEIIKIMTKAACPMVSNASVVTIPFVPRQVLFKNTFRVSQAFISKLPNQQLQQIQTLVCNSTSNDASDQQTEPFSALSASGSAQPEEITAPQAPQVASQISAALLRKSAAAADAIEALDILAEELDGPLTNIHCRALMAAALDRDNPDLAQSIFKAMTSSAAGTASTGSSTLLSSMDSAAGSSSSINNNGSSNSLLSTTLSWPPATTETASALVIGLCRSLRTREAVSVISSVRSRGLPTTEDVQFGYVVECPLNAVGKPLAIMQPQEGIRNVVDSFSKYEYELFSGRVINVTSESLVAESSQLLPSLGNLITGNSFLQRWGVLWRPSVGAVHTAVVETPNGKQRSFRFSTATADLPARQGDRITIVCAPQKVKNRQLYGLLSAAPPETKPGEPLSLTNHSLNNSSTQLCRPPKPGMTGGIPSWVIPTTAALVAADAASSLINPIFPYLVAGAVASTAATTIVAQKIALPRLKQLPERKLEIQATRQKLLSQHTSLEKRCSDLVRECEEDVRVLARLWQLQAKMGAVAGAGGTTYDARMERVSEARVSIESRLAKRIEMVEAYAKVISMIEIEVEMETQVPLSEMEGIEVQIAKLGEIEELQSEYKLQAEAQDEVERLLRTAL